MWIYRFRRAEAWGDEEKGTDWTTWGLDYVPGLRSTAVLCSMPCAQLAVQCPHQPSEVRCRSSTAAAAERHVGWILHSRESVEPINVANLRVNQRSQINEDTVEPSLAAQDIIL